MNTVQRIAELQTERERAEKATVDRDAWRLRAIQSEAERDAEIVRLRTADLTIVALHGKLNEADKKHLETLDLLARVSNERLEALASRDEWRGLHAVANERIVRYERLEKYLTRKNTPEEDAIEALTVGVPRQELVDLLCRLVDADIGGYYWVEKGLSDATAACKKWLGIKDEPVIEPVGSRE